MTLSTRPPKAVDTINQIGSRALPTFSPDAVPLASDLEAVRARLSGRPARHFIDGRWQAGVSGASLAVDDPATGAVIGTVAAGDEADIEAAVAAARHAFREGPWPRMSGAARAAVILRLADALERDQAVFAHLEALDAGHTLASIRSADLPLTLARLREAAGWATRIAGEVVMGPSTTAAMDYVLREPIGVVGIITPWNAPLLMVAQKLAAALATGCTAVIKPAELAPFSALFLAELCQGAGVPPGVVNVVTGRGEAAGRALAEHRDVNLVSFTGSTAVGRSILAAAGRTNLKRVVLELGGKSPVMVLADADLDKAAAAIAQEITFKSGQYCAAGSRLYAHASIFEPLLARLAARMRALRLGAGYAPGADMGPMISAAQRARAHGIVGEALAAGAVAVLGAAPEDGPGYFYRPTILTGVSAGMRALREEIFAPVLTATPVPDDAPLAAVAALANDSDFGLSAKVWTRDLGAAHALVRLLETGQVVVNGGGGDATLPFGGVKQSGYGRENGLEGLSAYLETKAVRLGYSA